MAIIFIGLIYIVSFFYAIIRTVKLHCIWYYVIWFIIFGLPIIYYAIKCRNPYKLYVLFGKKGSFKSTYMVKMMLKYHRKGWNIYSDIPDLLVKGARIIDPRDLETFTPETHSAIFLDEVGLTYDNRKFKTFKDGVNEWYKFQRKYRCVVYMNSQSLDIDLKLRSLIDRMYLCQSIGGFCAVLRPINRTITLTEPSSEAESRIADKLSFGWIGSWKFIWGPRWFKYFDSYSAPERPKISYSEVIADVREIRRTKAKHLLNQPRARRAHRDTVGGTF